MTPVKYECDSGNLTGTFAKSKILLTEKLANGALVTPTPGPSVSGMLPVCPVSPAQSVNLNGNRFNGLLHDTDYSGQSSEDTNSSQGAGFPVSFGKGYNVEPSVDTSDVSFKNFQAALASMPNCVIFSSSGKNDSQATSMLETLGVDEMSPPSVTWGLQPSLKAASNFLASTAQGDVIEAFHTPLIETELKPKNMDVFTLKTVLGTENYKLRMDPSVSFQPEPPTVHDSLRSYGYTPPKDVKVSYDTFLQMEEMARRAAIYMSISDSVVAKILKPLMPEIRKDPNSLELFDILKTAHQASSRCSVASAANFSLIRRDHVLDYWGAGKAIAQRARTAPFLGTNLMGPDAKNFVCQINILKQ